MAQTMLNTLVTEKVTEALEKVFPNAGVMHIVDSDDLEGDSVGVSAWFEDENDDVTVCIVNFQIKFM